MKQSFFLAWAGLKGRRRSTAFLLSTIILSAAFLVVMGLVGSSALYTMDLGNKDLYGEQKLVAWDLTDEQEAYFQNSSLWNEIGEMTIYGMVNSISETILGLGTMDEEAIRLGHIRLAEGRWPQAEDEIALEKSVYRYLGSQPYAVGDEIVLTVAAVGQERPEERSFRVVGLIENYSAVWREAYAAQMQDGSMGASPVTVSFFIAKPAGFSEKITETWLLNSRSSSYQTLHENLPQKAALRFNYSVYPEISYYGGTSEKALAVRQLAILVGGFVLICMMAVLLNGFLMLVEKRKRQFALLRCIGATKGQAYSCLFCEAFVLLGIGIPAGLMLGVFLSAGAVKFFSVRGGTALHYHFSAWVLIAAAAVCVLCGCLAVWLPAVRASKTAPIADTKPVYFSGKKRDFSKNGMELRPFGLALLSMRKAKGKTVLTTVTFALVIVVFSVMMMTDIVEYQNEGDSRQADAHLTAREVSDAIPVSVFSKLRALLGAASQNAVAVPGFSCRIPFSRYDSYLNGHFHFDYKMLELENWERWGQYHYSFGEQTLYGYGEDEYLVNPKIVIFDDSLLEQFRPYVTDGAVDIEAIRRGEEIILYMPDYDLLIQEEKNGVEFREQIANGAAQALKDARRMTNTGWAAGDILTFTWAEEQGDTYVLHERTVKVGAVVTGVLQTEGASLGVFGMAAGEETFENLKVPYKISDLYLSFGEDADIALAEAGLKQAVSRIAPLAGLEMRTETAVARQQQRSVRLAVSGMVTACLFVIGFFGMLNTVSGRIRSRLHEIGMLRCVGMTKGQVCQMFAYEGLVFGLLSSVLGAFSSFWMLAKFRENWMHTQMPFYLGAACLVCTALSVLMFFLPAGEMLRKNPTEMIRGKE